MTVGKPPAGNLEDFVMLGANPIEIMPLEIIGVEMTNSSEQVQCKDSYRILCWGGVWRVVVEADIGGR